MPELTLDRITKHFKNKIAVDNVSLTLREGVYGFLGAIGAGKTTAAHGMRRSETDGWRNPLQRYGNRQA